MRFLHISGLLVLSVQTYAVPARFHAFRARTGNGTYQDIRSCGDERGSCYVNGEGFLAEKDADGLLRVISLHPYDKMRKVAVRFVKKKPFGLRALEPKGSPEIPVIWLSFMDKRISETKEEVVK